METYDALRLHCLTAEQRAQTCGYWYTITSGPFAHTAFDTEDGVRIFCSERGLTIPDGALSHRGTYASYPIEGVYRHNMMLTDNPADVEAAPGYKTRTASNGQYVVANITTDPDGIKHVWTLNPNVKTRTVFDHQESRRMMGGCFASVC